MSRYDDRRDRHDDRRDRYDDRRDRFDDRRGSRNDDYGRGPPRDYDRDRYDRRDDRDRYDRHDRRDDRGRDRYDRRGGGSGAGRRDRDWGRIPDRENTRLHIANLSKSARYDDLKGLFEKYGGRVLNIDIKDGFGFVEFDSPRGADDAKRQLDNYKYEGENMKISWAKGKKPAFAAKGRGDFRLKVEGLDKRTSWQDLKDFARHAGEVVFTDVWFEDGHKFGVVEYRTADEMDTALRKLDGTTLDGSRVKLVPDPKGGSTTERKTDSRSPPPRGRSADRDRSRSPRSPHGRSPPPRSPADNSPAGRRSPPRSRSRTPPHSPDEAPRRNRSRTPE